MSAFRVNIAFASNAIINAGGGTPGGTNGVLFIDQDTKILKVVSPDGTILRAVKQVDDTIKFIV